MSTKSFEEFKRNKELKEAYQTASLIQENFALTMSPQVGVNPATRKQNEGFTAVQDVIAKIDAMTRMFDNAMQENSLDPSSQKVSEIIIKLYELAAIKLNEAKKKAQEYMDRITGKPNEPEMSSEMPEEEEEESEPEPERGMGMSHGPEGAEEEPEPEEKSKFSFAGGKSPEMPQRSQEMGSREPGAGSSAQDYARPRISSDEF